MSVLLFSDATDCRVQLSGEVMHLFSVRDVSQLCVFNSVAQNEEIFIQKGRVCCDRMTEYDKHNCCVLNHSLVHWLVSVVLCSAVQVKDVYSWRSLNKQYIPSCIALHCKSWSLTCWNLQKPGHETHDRVKVMEPIQFRSDELDRERLYHSFVCFTLCFFEWSV